MVYELYFSKADIKGKKIQKSYSPDLRPKCKQNRKINHNMGNLKC